MTDERKLWIAVIVVFVAISLIMVALGTAIGDVIVGTQEVELQWTAAPESDIDGYEVWRGTQADGSDRAKIHEGLVEGVSCKDSGLAEGHYYYWLRVVDNANNPSPWSDASELLIVDVTAPGKPGVITIVIKVSAIP